MLSIITIIGIILKKFLKIIKEIFLSEGNNFYNGSLKKIYLNKKLPSIIIFFKSYELYIVRLVF